MAEKNSMTLREMLSAKFIQIAVSEFGGGTNLFALDELGQVWNYNWEEETWETLSTARNMEHVDEVDADFERELA